MTGINPSATRPHQTPSIRREDPSHSQEFAKLGLEHPVRDKLPLLADLRRGSHDVSVFFVCFSLFDTEFSNALMRVSIQR